ncbi:hypothetical protein LIER_01111 [Lithospermum erythrorhizon]|uniref:Uncharacterized protein n=1 Tax=Lithospermum erythrorhizon TaxID=34254 RepID=A0AAV3NM53_LITER
MGCGESKHAVATVDTISKPSDSATITDGKTSTNVATETSNGDVNAPNGEKKDDSNGVTKEEIVPGNGELPSQVENVKDDGKKNDGAVVAEAKEDDGAAKEECKEEPKEKNVDNQETTPEKTTSEGDAAATKEEDSINQKNEENKQGPEAASSKEENIPKAEEKAAESKEDSKAN